MRRIAISVCCLVVLAGATSSEAAVSRHRGRPVAECSLPAHAHVLTADSQAVVYTVRERVRTKAETSTVIETRACLDGRTHSVKIGRESVSPPMEGGGRIKRLVLAGTVVAYEITVPGDNRHGRQGRPSAWHVFVRQLKTGRLIHHAPTGSANPPNPHFVGDGEAVAIVVEEDGAVAWITDTHRSKDRYQVHALDSTGERVLAVGSAIGPQSLGLAGSMLYWTQAGKPESATLN